MGPNDIYVPYNLPGTQPATASNWGAVFRNNTDQVLELVDADERHETAGNDAGAVSCVLSKAPSGTAKGSATAMTASVNLKGTADTKQTLAPVATNARFLLPGETMFAILTGTPTSLAGVSIAAYLRPRP